MSYLSLNRPISHLVNGHQTVLNHVRLFPVSPFLQWYPSILTYRGPRRERNEIILAFQQTIQILVVEQAVEIATSCILDRRRRLFSHALMYLLDGM